MKLITIRDEALVDRDYPAPTRAKLYPKPKLSTFVPSNGPAIVQRSGSRGNTGDLSGRRTLEWDALPLSSPAGVTFDGTLALLKALEGKDSVLNLGATWGGVYSSNTNIKILSVDPIPVGVGASGALWHRVKMEFVER